MTEAHVGPLLAVFRELDGTTQSQVTTHLATCERCRVLQSAYASQDRLLSKLQAASPSPRMLSQVRQRLTAPAQGVPTRRLPRLGLVAMLLALFLALNVGAIVASAQALPGDLFYPVKRTMERVTLTLMRASEARADYENMLAERRQLEVRRLLELQRRATSVEFAGDLAQEADGSWVVGGIPVDLEQSQVDRAGIQLGNVVRVEGEASDGRLRVLNIQPERRGENAPVTAPTARHTPTPSATISGTGTPTEEAERGPRISLTPTDTDMPTMTPAPSSEAGPSPTMQREGPRQTPPAPKGPPPGASHTPATGPRLPIPPSETPAPPPLPASPTAQSTPPASSTPTLRPRQTPLLSGTPPASPAASPTAPRVPGATATGRARQSPPPAPHTPVASSPTRPATPTPGQSPDASGGASVTPQWPHPPSASPPRPTGTPGRR